MNDGMRTEYFGCQCHSDEHLFKFTIDDDPSFRNLFLSVFLAEERKWYKRAWSAIKYVLGYKSKYGHWDEIIMTDDDVKRLQEVLSAYMKTSPDNLAKASQAFEKWATRIKTDVENQTGEK